MEARERFAAIASLPDGDIRLAEAALWLAAEANPSLDVAAYLARLDALAEGIRPGFLLADDLPDQVGVLNRELFDVQGFQGSRDEYYDPRNSFLDQVIERRTGIPISLCVLYIDVAQRLGLDAVGVNFPGHFLARVGPEPLIVDAFEGRLATRDECAVRLRTALGPEAQLRDEHLAPAANKLVLLRMLGNLKSIYAQQRDFEAALGCCERSLLLFPDTPGELRDRGLMYHALDCPRPALADLERYLELAPEAEGVDTIRRLVGELHTDLPSIH